MPRHPGHSGQMIYGAGVSYDFHTNLDRPLRLGPFQGRRRHQSRLQRRHVHARHRLSLLTPQFAPLKPRHARGFSLSGPNRLTIKRESYNRRMKVNGKPMRSIWPIGDSAVGVIDQSVLPHRFETRELGSAAAVEQAIRTMVVRGAPLIGVTGAYGLALALRSDPSDARAGRRARAAACRPDQPRSTCAGRSIACARWCWPATGAARRTPPGSRPAASPRKTSS